MLSWRAVGALLAAGTLGACTVGVGGCGGKAAAAHHTSDSARLTVLAAASLAKVLPKIDSEASYTFGGSGALEAQIEQGAPADVFAAAAAKQPAELYAKGLVERPVRFATNQLVLIVPRDNPAHIRSIADITRPGVKLVICDVTVPCGDYARAALRNLDISAAAMRNVASQTTDVTQTVAEVALGQADAGFVYLTDAYAARGKLQVIRLPARAKPKAEDYAAVVKATRHLAAARAFVMSLLSPRGQRILRAAGFGPP